MSRNSIVGSIQSLDSTKFCFTPDYSVRATTEVLYVKSLDNQNELGPFSKTKVSHNIWGFYESLKLCVCSNKINTYSA